MRQRTFALLVSCCALAFAAGSVTPAAQSAPVGRAAAQTPPGGARVAGAAGAPGRTMETPTWPLWDHAAPGAQGTADEDIPTLTYFPAYGRGSGTAVVIAPGGAYTNLAVNHEGRQVANFLNSLGITAFVLKYRLGPKYHHPIELGDAQRAIRLVRARAAEFNVLPDRVGMMGFSAGGHLTATAGTHFDAGNANAADPVDRVSSRPDFLVLGYPVITMKDPYAHRGSRQNLLGDNPDPALVEDLSNELKVTADTPPTFLFHTTADTTVPVENSVLFYLALHKNNVPAELHVFQSGPHGVGLALNDPALEAWPTLLAHWLRARGLLTRPEAAGRAAAAPARR